MQQRNIADKKEIKTAEEKRKLRRLSELNDVREILALPAGRRFLHRILAETRVHKSVWHPSAEIHKRAGAQEIGHFVLKEIVDADQKTAALMVAEAYSTELEGDNYV